MGPTARRPHSDEPTPQSSPPVPLTTFDDSSVATTHSETIEILWLDDDGDDQQTLRIVTDADKTLKLDEQHSNIERAIAALSDGETHRGECREAVHPETGDTNVPVESAHPITAGQTSKLPKNWLVERSPQPQPIIRPSLPRHDAVVSKTPFGFVVAVALLGILLGVGVTVLTFLVAPEVRGLLPPEGPIQEEQRLFPVVSTAAIPSTTEAPSPLPFAAERQEPTTDTPSHNGAAQQTGASTQEQEVEPSLVTIPDELVLPVTFHVGRHRIASTDTEALRSLAKAMIAAPRARFDLVGYALPSETDDRSQARLLADRRARAVRDVIRALGPSKRRLSPRAAQYQEPLLVDQPVGATYQAVILRVTRR